jgi:hypothetical protein
MRVTALPTFNVQSKLGNCRDMWRKLADFLLSYPEILTVPAPFLRNPENCASEIQAAVKGIQQCKRDREEFDEFPAHVRAYHYVRAWAIQRGLLSPNNLTSKDIITLCMESSPELHGDECRDFDAIVRWFFPGYLAQHTLNLGITPYPESNSKDLVELLERLDREPLHKKMGYSHYIRVGVMHAGCSDIQAGQWLSLVERRLEKLKGSKSEYPTKNHTTLTLNPTQIYKPISKTKRKSVNGPTD